VQSGVAPTRRTPSLAGSLIPEEGCRYGEGKETEAVHAGVSA
jgi:hypothetical protein